MIRPARQYSAAPDLAILICYFNSENFRSKYRNLLRFLRPIVASGSYFQIVECAFGQQPFVLSPSQSVLSVRARDVMWQKERLLNIALASLPRQYTKVAWLDCDLLFENAQWMSQTSVLLDKCAVVQPFKHVVRLSEGHTVFHGKGDRWKSFGAVYKKTPDLRLKGHFDRHGHTGFAWAARRELLEDYGLYDFCIAGSGDHMIAHGFCGDLDSPCIRRILCGNSAHHCAFERWARAVSADVRGRIGYVPGTILHLWHGDLLNRRYVLRNEELAAFHFDPERDLRVGPNGCWEWNSVKPDLHRWALEYFGKRQEDGVPLVQASQAHGSVEETLLPFP
jgi:hypothetical protein